MIPKSRRQGRVFFPNEGVLRFFREMDHEKVKKELEEKERHASELRQKFEELEEKQRTKSDLDKADADNLQKKVEEYEDKLKSTSDEHAGQMLVRQNTIDGLQDTLGSREEYIKGLEQRVKDLMEAVE